MVVPILILTPGQPLDCAVVQLVLPGPLPAPVRLTCSLVPLQKDFTVREELQQQDVERWLGFITFLCEVFGTMRSSTGEPFRVLVCPIYTCLREVRARASVPPSPPADIYRISAHIHWRKTQERNGVGLRIEGWILYKGDRRCPHASTPRIKKQALAQTSIIPNLELGRRGLWCYSVEWNFGLGLPLICF